MDDQKPSLSESGQKWRDDNNSKILELRAYEIDAWRFVKERYHDELTVHLLQYEKLRRSKPKSRMGRMSVGDDPQDLRARDPDLTVIRSIADAIDDPELSGMLRTASRLKQSLATDNIGLARHVARLYRRKNVSFDDIVNESIVGMMSAIGRFKFEKNVTFSTYAPYWCKHHIRRYLTDKHLLIRIPTGRTFNELGCSDLKRSEVYKPSVRSMDASISTVKGESNKTLHDVISSSSASDDETLTQKDRNTVRKLMDDLPLRNRAIISAVFGFDGNGGTAPAEVARKLGLSRSRIAQIIQSTLDTLRGKLEPITGETTDG